MAGSVAIERDEELGSVLIRLRFASCLEDIQATRLSGGVSADIWKVRVGNDVICVKRARSRLKVAQEWCVPAERIAYERKWYSTVGTLLPGLAPAVLAYDDASKTLVMQYLPPDENRLWKSDLAMGRVDAAFAGAVGARLAAVHARTAGSEELAREFQTDSLFEALRLDPYLRQIARVHWTIADRVNALANSILLRKVALIHGDVSPKNILVSPNGPIFLDAECAWYGDPAFDVAFLLTHLLLKCVWIRCAAREFLGAFHSFISSYRAQISWEKPSEVETRVVALLPALLLARIDGKSPVEYLTSEADRGAVRHCALQLIREPVSSIGEICARFSQELRL